MEKITISSQISKSDLADSLNISHLTKVQQEKIISMLMDNVASQINIAVWGRLSEEDRSEFKNIAKSGNKKAVEFISSRIENFPALVETITRQTVNDFREKRAGTK